MLALRVFLAISVISQVSWINEGYCSVTSVVERRGLFTRKSASLAEERQRFVRAVGEPSHSNELIDGLKPGAILRLQKRGDSENFQTLISYGHLWEGSRWALVRFPGTRLFASIDLADWDAKADGVAEDVANPKIIAERDFKNFHHLREDVEGLADVVLNPGWIRFLDEVKAPFNGYPDGREERGHFTWNFLTSSNAARNQGLDEIRQYSHGKINSKTRHKYTGILIHLRRLEGTDEEPLVYVERNAAKLEWNNEEKKLYLPSLGRWIPAEDVLQVSNIGNNHEEHGGT